MDWLNDIATAVKSAPSVSSTPPKQETKPSPRSEAKQSTVKTESKPQPETMAPEPKATKIPDKETEPKIATPGASKPKGSAADWLGLNDADDEDDEPASWMRTKSQQKVKNQFNFVTCRRMSAQIKICPPCVAFGAIVTKILHQSRCKKHFKYFLKHFRLLIVKFVLINYQGPFLVGNN